MIEQFLSKLNNECDNNIEKILCCRLEINKRNMGDTNKKIKIPYGDFDCGMSQ